MERKIKWLSISTTILLAAIAIIAIVVDSARVLLPVSASAGVLLLICNVINRLIDKVGGWDYFSSLLFPSRERQSYRLDRGYQPVQRYLNARRKRFQDEAKHSFVPMVYKTVANARLRHETKYGDPLDIYNRYPQFVLVGLPGVGKTMVLVELFNEIANAHLSPKASEPMPLWIPLNDPKNPIDADDLFRYWCDSPEKYNLETSFDSLLATRAPVILLDGLNEMPIESRARRAVSLRVWLDANPSVHVIVTCRTRDYQDDPSINLGPIPQVHVEPFEKQQMYQFLEIVAHERADELMTQIEMDDATFHLAQIPLHLSMLTQLSLWHPNQKRMPNRLKALYDEYLEARYAREKREKKGVHLSWPMLQERMEKLAYKMVSPDQESEGSISRPEKTVEKLIGKKALKDAYNLQLLVSVTEKPTRHLLWKKTSRRIQFFHQSLHGFFALPRLNRALQQRGFSFFGIAANNVPVIIRQIGDLGDTAEIAVETLIPLLSNKDQTIQIATASALTDIGIAAIYPVTKELASKDVRVRELAREILTNIGEPSKGPLLIYALKHNEEHINQQIADILTNVPNTPYELIQALRERLSKQNEFGAWVADALGKIRSSRAVQPLLCMLNDEDTSVRLDIAWALGQIGDKVAGPPLVKLIESEDDPLIEVYAVDAIGRIGEDAIALLLEALRNSSGSQRERVRSAIFRMCSKDELSVQHIMDIVKSDNHEAQIREAAGILAKEFAERQHTASEVYLRFWPSQ